MDTRMLAERDNPPELFPADCPLDGDGGLWWVARVRPRQEKALAWDLLRASVSYFLPMYEAVRRSRQRSWKTKLPLFAGYLFFRGQENQRLGALKTGRVADLLAVHDQQQLVRELTAIQRLIESGIGVDPYPALRRGVRCRIRSGPLQGIEGKVAQRRARSRFVVEVGILGQGAAVTIDGSLLEPVD